MLVYSSTQHPGEVQHKVAHALGVASHRVAIECRRMGGGFGGKESQPSMLACAAAVMARRLGRAVKLRLDRDDDFMITGKRHDFIAEYDVGFDDSGRVLGLDLMLASRCGYSADLSGPVNDRAVSHADNCYSPGRGAHRVASLQDEHAVATAFRGFGGPQGMMAAEQVMDEIARSLGRDPLDVRRANFYVPGERDVTHYDMKVEDFIADRLVDAARARQRLPRAARGDRAMECAQPGDQPRHRADAGEVRHLVHGDVLQPGRRAAACLYRRQRAAEPRRHGNGPGPVHQGRAGGGRGTRHRSRDGARVGVRHQQDARTRRRPRPRQRQRHERQGGAGRGAERQGAARRVRGGEVGRARRRRRLRRQRRTASARRSVPFAELVAAGVLRPRAAVGQRLLQDAEDRLGPARPSRAGRSSTSPTARRCPKSRSIPSPANAGCCASTSCTTSAAR